MGQVESTHIRPDSTCNRSKNFDPYLIHLFLDHFESGSDWIDPLGWVKF
jgi:hypothetical protein